MYVKGKDVTEACLISHEHMLPSPCLTAVCSCIQTATFRGVFANNSSYSPEGVRLEQAQC